MNRTPNSDDTVDQASEGTDRMNESTHDAETSRYNPLATGRARGLHFLRQSKPLTRRTLLKAFGGTAAVAVGAKTVLAGATAPVKARVARPVAYNLPIKRYKFAGTDGWVSMPAQAAAMPPYFPDPAGPPIDLSGTVAGNFTTYVFGFRDLTSVADNAVIAQKNHAQISAPVFTTQVGQDLRLTLHNLGLANRPDLIDSHTIHFHGFSNQIAYFDGVPDASLSVPIGRFLEYRYIPVDPGTYMWHCHVEDVEHVQMGMNGLCFVAPKLGQNYAYEDPSTRFDRQFSIHLSEIYAVGHYNDRHGQDTDWTDYNGTFRLMNGRAYPDTVYPNSDPLVTPTGTNPDPYRLRYQPNSALIQAEEGETILVRIAHLGYEEHSLMLPGLNFTVIGRDAKYQGGGRTGYFQNEDSTNDATRADVRTTGNRIDLGSGESRDLLITIPTGITSGSGPAVFPLYDRNYGYANPKTGSTTGYGGERTEIHVWPQGSLKRPTTSDLAIAATDADAMAFQITGGQIQRWSDGSPVLQRHANQLFTTATGNSY